MKKKMNLALGGKVLPGLGVRVNAAGFPVLGGNYCTEQHEHDACGVGFVAHIDDVPRHSLVENALDVMANLEHRGAVGADNATGDGAGIMCGVPDKFFREVCDLKFALPKLGEYGVAMVFLPMDLKARNSCMKAMEDALVSNSLNALGWREVPIVTTGLGDLSLATIPYIMQLFISAKDGVSCLEAFERKLCVARRTAEKFVAKIASRDVSQYYVCSMSAKTIIYKGMLTGKQLRTFFPDLSHEAFESAFGLVHQRYSTNTLPTWQLAQPFRFVAHNGEINTVRGNISSIRAAEAGLYHRNFGADIESFKPVIDERGSDSAMFDNALELLYHGGRSLPHSMCMMVPEPWSQKIHMSSDKRAFYEFHSAIMEPWDGPAALAFCDGRYIGGTLDRNGLRPCRYLVTRDGFVVLASETGVLDIPADNLLECGRLRAGRMFLIDLKEHRIVPDQEIKSVLSRRKPYRHWIKDNQIELRGLFSHSNPVAEDENTLMLKQRLHGYTREDMKMILSPMASFGQEPIGSMGNDAALAVLSKRPQILFAYFKQLFAQVTNPPIDPLREELVMSLLSWLGRKGNLLDEAEDQCRMLRLRQPILMPHDVQCLRETAPIPGLKTACIDTIFPVNEGGKGLEAALNRVFEQAESAIDNGVTVLILSDRNCDENYAPIPAMLVASGLHHHLIRQGKRTQAGIVLETGEAREVIHFAMLIAFGCNAVCPHVAFSTVQNLANFGLLDREVDMSTAAENYVTAIKKGLLKTFSRMGISTVRSFFGSQIFEAVGIGQAVIQRYFPYTASRIGGVGLEEIAAESIERHKDAFHSQKLQNPLLDVGGVYHARMGGEEHLFTAQAIHFLHQAVRTESYTEFKKFSAEINNQSERRVTLRSLLDFVPGIPVPVEEVEPVENIVKRFVVSAMSYGSLSNEAHETLATAMNRLGAGSNCGEGGEDPRRYVTLANGDCLRSRIKQVASGRFGVTNEYLVNADELQIKVAQGAKPGEGGQLPGHKVSEEIARVRHTTPGVTLISPPPHHDIYSIEDLAQLIFDLKSANRLARVSVKLVSEVGVGTIASGVAKAQADMVLIAGHDGGTGASPLTAIKHAGLPWELGLAETQQSLRANGLRGRIRVQVDGQLRTGRDLAIATLLGAEEYGFATVALVALGCTMMRKCHLNTCPFGVATQDPELRKRFNGKPEHVMNYFLFLAREFREVMAELGFRSVDEMVGHVERLKFDAAKYEGKPGTLDFNSLLTVSKSGASVALRCEETEWRRFAPSYDDTLLPDLDKAISESQNVERELSIKNINRSVGTRLSGEIARKHGYIGLPAGTIKLNFKGVAGQSFGAFLANGVELTVEGAANDYVGKGMSGGRIVVRQPKGTRFRADRQVIAGNVMLYGATGGEVFVNGMVGERFCVRNSGATAVVEGVGDHGCEYMTGGVAVILGSTGINFAAGMSGGVAYVYDSTGLFDTNCNLDMVDIEPLFDQDKILLRSLLVKHKELTGSPKATLILEHWDSELSNFVKVMPVDYRKALERMSVQVHKDDDTVAATEEVLR